MVIFQTNLRFLATFSGQVLEIEEDTDCWYSESTSATSSVNSSEYNSDDGFIDIESEDAKISSFSVSRSTQTKIRDPFLEGPNKSLHQESCSKILNLMITELLYSHIRNTYKGSLHTRSFSCNTSPFADTDELKNGFLGPKRFQGFRETGCWCATCICVLLQVQNNISGFSCESDAGVLIKVIPLKKNLH